MSAPTLLSAAPLGEAIIGRTAAKKLREFIDHWRGACLWCVRLPQMCCFPLFMVLLTVRCYAQALELVRAMYQKCKLVHADLSEYNILYHKKVRC